MKSNRAIFLCLGLLFIIFDVISNNMGRYDLSDTSIAYNVGYIIGANFSLIVGLILLHMAYVQHKKLKRKENA